MSEKLTVASLIDTIDECEKEIAAGAPRHHFFFSTNGKPIGKKSLDRLAWEERHASEKAEG